jgi:hypothetical protein
MRTLIACLTLTNRNRSICISSTLLLVGILTLVPLLMMGQCTSETLSLIVVVLPCTDVCTGSKLILTLPNISDTDTRVFSVPVCLLLLKFFLDRQNIATSELYNEKIRF